VYLLVLFVAIILSKDLSQNFHQQLNQFQLRANSNSRVWGHQELARVGVMLTRSLRVPSARFFGGSRGKDGWRSAERRGGQTLFICDEGY